MNKVVLLVANPYVGFKVYGPFDSSVEAGNYALGRLLKLEEWWVMTLNPPVTVSETDVSANRQPR